MRYTCENLMCSEVSPGQVFAGSTSYLFTDSARLIEKFKGVPQVDVVCLKEGPVAHGRRDMENLSAIVDELDKENHYAVFSTKDNKTRFYMYGKHLPQIGDRYWISVILK